SKTAMETVLDYLSSHTEYLEGDELMTYAEKLLGNLTRLWSDGISRKLSSLLLALSRKQIWLRNEYQNLIVEAIAKNDPQRHAIRRILIAPDVQIERLHTLDAIIARCLTADLARLLVELCTDPPTLVHFAREVDRRNNLATTEIYEILKPHTAGLLNKYEENVRAFTEKQERERKKKMLQEFRLTCELRSGKEIAKIQQLAHEVPASRWPDLTQRQKNVLSALIGDHMIKTSALDNVTWLSKETYQYQRYPHDSSLLCLRMVRHYNLQLSDSSMLINHLPYGGEHEQLIISYFQSNGLTNGDKRILEALLNMALPEIGLRPLICMIRELRVSTETILAKLAQVVRDQSRDSYFRLDVLRAYIKAGDSSTTDFLIEILRDPDERLVKEATEELVRRQHVPTIMRLLKGLVIGKPQIPNGTVWSFRESGIEWFDLIETSDRAVWMALSKVMNYTIESRKYSFLYSLITKMARINRRQTLGIIQKRLPSARDPSLRSMLTRFESEFEVLELHEIGRIKSINNALEIIAYTKALRRIYIFVEGPNDAILYRAIQAKFSDVGILPRDVKYFFVPQGGWDNIYAQRANFGDWIEMHRPDPIFILVDRDAKPGTINDCEAAWRRLGIPYHILKRRSPEDYYPKELLKRILGHTPNSKAEIKNRIAKIAESLTLRDIIGTDLYQVFANTLKNVIA
ncbi:MAG: hypothetical protein ABSC55_22925, partial [Syntrophorhabdales bacterium]